MYTEPMMIAVSKEINASMYIDFQTVRRADGLSLFQAIALSASSSGSSSVLRQFPTLVNELQFLLHEEGLSSDSSNP